jgi:dienelactone hydrolase
VQIRRFEAAVKRPHQAFVRVVTIAVIVLAFPGATIAPARAQDSADLISRPRSDGATTRMRLFGPSEGCMKTAIFSHGLGGGISTLPLLLPMLAQQGWRVLAIEHVESGPQALEGMATAASTGEFFRARAGDPHRHLARFADVEVAFGEALRFCRPRQLLFIGYSMGATTAVLEAGGKTHFSVKDRDTFGKNRFDAYVALSPRGAGILFPPDGWRGVTKPMLMVTGPDDASVEGDWRTRLSAFEGLPPDRKRLAIVPGASHFALGGYTEPTASKLSALIAEFAASVAGGGALAASTVPGIETRDK